MGLSESPTNNELLCMCKSLTTQPARPQLENMDFRDDPISIWLVVDLLWKMMDESSVGMKWNSRDFTVQFRISWDLTKDENGKWTYKNLEIELSMLEDQIWGVMQHDITIRYYQI
jgi:hypothetical protein